MRKGKIVTIIILILAILIAGFFVVNVKLNEKKEQDGYIQSAQNEYDVIISNIESEEYHEAITKIQDYERLYTEDDKYYYMLPEILKSKENFLELKDKISNELIEKSSSLYEKLDANDNITYSADYDDITMLEDYLSLLIGSYDVLNVSNHPTRINIETLEEKLVNCRYTKALVLYNHGDKSEGISILKSLNLRDDLTYQMEEAVDAMLNLMISSNRATGFEILSGSKEVRVFKNGRNYGWQCPYCGYFTEAVGTASIVSELNQHYSGEISTIPGMMTCAGKWVGGCGQMSQYTLTIKYK